MIGRTTKTMRKLNRITRGRVTLGRMLRAIRMCDYGSAEELASKLSISTDQLRDIEDGSVYVDNETARAFAKLLGGSEKQFIRVNSGEFKYHVGCLEVRQ